METIIKENILKDIMNGHSDETGKSIPVNVDIKKISVSNMTFSKTLITNDNSYFIRYGGDPLGNSYNAIEVYSSSSLDDNTSLYTFDSIKIGSNLIYIIDMKQSKDGRFYGIGKYATTTNEYYYLIIFNNFIQDGYLEINKYYSSSTMGLSSNIIDFLNVAKVENQGIYFITAYNSNTNKDVLIRFEINILEGNKLNIVNVINTGGVEGSSQIQLNVLQDKLIYTTINEDSSDGYKIEYSKCIIDVNKDLQNDLYLMVLENTILGEETYVPGVSNKKYQGIIPGLYKYNDGTKEMRVDRINLNGEDDSLYYNNFPIEKTENFYFNYEEPFIAITDGAQIYLFLRNSLQHFEQFYSQIFNDMITDMQILKQFNIYTLIGLATNDGNQSIVVIKNIYNSKISEEPYYNHTFARPLYLNLYNKINDKKSIVYCNNKLMNFYSGNQITSRFNIPNYLLNDKQIEEINVYGDSSYLINNIFKNISKNKFESLYLSFIYNLNVINNTNGQNSLDMEASNKLAKGLWIGNGIENIRKARITYKDLTTKIIYLNMPDIDEIAGTTASFSYTVTGNVIKIEYLNSKEDIIYATFRTNLTGTNTITQTIRVE